MKKDLLMRAYVVTVVLIFAIVVLGQLIGQDAFNTQQNDIRSVSLARKEATLSQEISKSALSMEFASTEAKFNALKKSILDASKELEQIHNALQVRDGSLDLDVTPNPVEIEELFNSIKTYYQAIITASDNLANLQWSDDERTKLVTIRSSINSILNTETQFMNYIDAIVTEYEAQFQSHETGLGTYSFILFGALVGLLLLQAILIFKPAVNLANKNFLSANAAFQRLKKSEREIRRSTERQLEINENLILTQRAVKRKNRQLQESEKELLKRTEEQIKANEKLIAAQGQIEESLEKQKTINNELIEAREYAQVNEERLDAAIKGAKDGIWDWNLVTNEVYFSPQYKKMLGYADDEMENDFSEWESKIHPDHLSTAKEKVEEYLSGRTDNYEYEFKMQHKDGHYLWILTRGAAIKDTTGKPIRFAGSHTDVTERREFNRKLQESEDRMRNIAEEQLEVSERMIVAERKLQRTLELEKKSKEELAQALEYLKGTQSQLVQSEKMASLGQLTAGIAHEINNPINFVYNGIDTLKMSFDELLVILEKYNELDNTDNIKEVMGEIKELKEEYVFDELVVDIQELVSDIKKGAVRTIEIVKGLRVFSRLDEEEMKEANVNESIDATLILLKNKTKNKLEIKKYYDETIDGINCFPGQLNQVFMNILNNAIQAIPEERKDGKLEIYTENQEEHVMIRIKDNGKGMSEQVKKRIFEPFFTTKEVGIGTGLGMSISYGIVEKHGGNIYVNSEEGRGTEFSIQIPKNLEEKEEKPAEKEEIKE
ncbi:MAG: ATP-binding protein [Cyclobacteriaceae bacterium]